ncbi:MAG TPA: VOC family protein [Allosphingosinicella sp.]|jgi:lactoylglutathione lyase
MRIAATTTGLLALAACAGAAAPPEAPPAGATVRLDHLAIHAADVAASVEFYRDVFGLREIPSPVSGPRWLDAGPGVALHILPGRTAPVPDDRSVHLALATSGLGPILERLRERGVAWQDFAGTPGAISHRPDGIDQIYLRDPDGYWIEVNDTMK